MKRKFITCSYLFINLIFLLLLSCGNDETDDFTHTTIPADAEYIYTSFIPEVGKTYGFKQGEQIGCITITGKAFFADTIPTVSFKVDDRPFNYTLDKTYYSYFSNKYLTHEYGCMRYCDIKKNPEDVLFGFFYGTTIVSGQTCSAPLYETYFTIGY